MSKKIFFCDVWYKADAKAVMLFQEQKIWDLACVIERHFTNHKGMLTQKILKKYTIFNQYENYGF